MQQTATEVPCNTLQLVLAKRPLQNDCLVRRAASLEERKKGKKKETKPGYPISISIKTLFSKKVSCPILKAHIRCWNWRVLSMLKYVS